MFCVFVSSHLFSFSYMIIFLLIYFKPSLCVTVILLIVSDHWRLQSKYMLISCLVHKINFIVRQNRNQFSFFFHVKYLHKPIWAFLMLPACSIFQFLMFTYYVLCITKLLDNSKLILFVKHLLHLLLSFSFLVHILINDHPHYIFMKGINLIFNNMWHM